MKQVQNSGRQGDVRFVRCSVPAHAEKTALSENVVVAGNASGHHHVVLGGKIEHYTDPKDSLNSYIRLTEPCEVKHLREHHAHESLLLPAGEWKIRRQREHTPDGFRMVQD